MATLTRGRPSQFGIRAVVVLAGLALGVLFLALAFAQAPGNLSITTVLVVLVGWAFLLRGAHVWGRRPENRLGAVMAGLGLMWLLGEVLRLVDSAPVFTAGVWISDLWNVPFVFFLLAFPTGYLATRDDRIFLWIFVIVTVPLQAAWLLFWDPANGPGNALAIWPDNAIADNIDTVQRALIIVGALLVVAHLARRWYRASVPMRRALTPILAGAVAMALGTSLSVLFKLGIPIQPIVWIVLIAYIGVAVAGLSSVLHGQRARAALADLVVELGETPAPERLRDALAHALGDPSLRVAYWSPSSGTFVDQAGQDVAMPAEGSGRAVTRLERDGVPLAALVHDAALLDDPGLVASVASAMRLAVENERLHERVLDQLEEVRASRARIVEAGDSERRRVERDLHDGAQQRLVSMSLALRLARTRLGEDGDPAVRASLEQASDEAKAALSELRELARGIHPQVLTEAGLAAAVESLAGRSPVDVTVEIDAGQRFSSAVESTAYFVIAEAWTNVAKYAVATRVLVRTAWTNELLTVEVEDDGIGGATPAAGSGLRGLADRLAAIDGKLDVVSPTGGGTRLLARIPTPGRHNGQAGPDTR